MKTFTGLLITRYLRARRGFAGVVTWFSLIGIILGVAALIVVMAVMAGFREELLGRILGVTGHATVQMAQQTTWDDALKVQEKLEALPTVSSAQPYVQGQGMAIASGRAMGVVVRGINLHNEKGQSIFFDNIISGKVENLDHPNTVAIGSGLARQMGLGVGAPITLLSPQGSATVMGFIPRMQKFRVGAIFNVGMYLYDNSWIYTNAKTAQKFYGTGDNISALDVKVTQPDQVDALTADMYDAIGVAASINTWQSTNKQFFEALEVERVAMFLILSLIIVVAAFNIITGQTMVVNDKRPDIAILRTMGSPRRAILRIFFLNGALLGTIGTVGGIVIGIIVLNNLTPIVSFMEMVFGVSIFSGEVYFLEDLPHVVVWGDVFNVGCLSMGLSLLASLYPAWRASLLDPVEILRNE